LADPLFWLALSFLLVVVSLTAVLIVAIPALRELGRAARSAEKMFDTLSRELPPTLEAIRLTGLEITELTDDVTEGVQSAGQVVQQVNQSLTSAQTQAQRLNTGTKSLWAGARAAWRTWVNDPSSQAQRADALPKRPAVRTSSTKPQSAPDQASQAVFPPGQSPLPELSPGSEPPSHNQLTELEATLEAARQDVADLEEEVSASSLVNRRPLSPEPWDAID
jgi:hypothetical protein